MKLYKDEYTDLKTNVDELKGSPVCESGKRCTILTDRKFAKSKNLHYKDSYGPI